MIKTCKKCGRTYNDATQWKDCPHYHKPEDDNRRPEDNAMDDPIRLGPSIMDDNSSSSFSNSDNDSGFSGGGGDFGGGGSSGDW